MALDIVEKHWLSLSDEYVSKFLYQKAESALNTQMCTSTSTKTQIEILTSGGVVIITHMLYFKSEQKAGLFTLSNVSKLCNSILFINLTLIVIFSMLMTVNSSWSKQP